MHLFHENKSYKIAFTIIFNFTYIHLMFCYFEANKYKNMQKCFQFCVVYPFKDIKQESQL